MKKVISALILIIFVSLNVPALAVYTMAESVEKNINKISELMQPCADLLSEGTKNQSSLKMVEFCDCALKQDITTLDGQAQKDFKIQYTQYIYPTLLKRIKSQNRINI